ncbi:bifunctional adenosylcobinamide kinase/adenosylcobinamide-phosphate guanylyltransferase [Teredinibacter purpureus]|uniref:bifunctional adenosylcobinamide kinase/adenosylcobinamide-phosphate guanylyltransferase n=1 Tax=Teredinibacter purpureus TaxID=2731756 RepID=UPI0005F790EC|nr:bifunctional adenosylcobinamide kinase/adenosylcobinamide-phosphate guanylyltransferase [Teredinibacter purpureus]
MKSLILGGARSGKSTYAETLALRNDNTVIYVATGWAGDNEMTERIENHKASRPAHWQTIEEPLGIADILTHHNHANTTILVDCLTLWLSNCLANKCFDQEKNALLNVLPTLQADIIFVSNEVGSGVVPLGQLSREFVDNSGWLHQSLAAHCDNVTLVVAGLPLPLKAINTHSLKDAP